MPEDVAVRLLSTLTPNAENGITWRDIVSNSHQRANIGQSFATDAARIEFERSYLKIDIFSKALKAIREYKVFAGAMSHSEDTVRQVFNEVFAFPFIPSNPSRKDSIEDITRALTVDYTKEHLFRPDHKGYTRTYILAPDDETKAPAIRDGRVIYPPRAYPDVLQPHELHDSDLMRYQFSNFRWREPVLTATGEMVDDILKINDDFFQGIQMVYFKKLLNNIPLTPAEQREVLMPESLRTAVIEQITDQGVQDMTLQRRILEERKLDAQKTQNRGNGQVLGLGRYARR
jgi:hypothetical protein